MLPHIERTLSSGASVLDVGAGSGRDVAAMIDGGFHAFGVEPSTDMLQKALHLHPSLRGRLAQVALPRLGRPFSERVPGGFDAVVCSAVLMHLDPDEMLQALESMVEQLRVPTSDDVEATSPALFVSLPHMEPSRLVGHRDRDGRQFHNHDPDPVRAHLSRLGVSFKQEIDSHAVFASTGTVWKTLVFRRDS
jgi:SAM-dependent methyltransferase